MVFFSKFYIALVKHAPFITLFPRNACPNIVRFYSGSEKSEISANFYRTNKLVSNTFLGLGGESLIMDPFAGPRANLLIAVDGVDSSILPQKGLERVSLVEKVDGKCVSTPSLSKFVTLLTGKSLFKHGIHGEHLMNKNGVVAAAYTRQGTYHAEQSFADRLVKKHPEATIVSISSKPQFAFAGVPLEHHKNSQSFFWKDGKFDGVTSEWIFSKVGTLLKHFPKSLYSAETKIFHFVTESHEAKFDLSVHEDFMFFVEMVGATKILSRKAKEASKKPSVASFTFVFASLKDLAGKYGLEEKYLTALAAIDVMIPKMITKFAKAFNGRTTAQVTALGGLQLQLKNMDLHMSLESNLLAPLDKHFPSIYVKDSSPQLCDTIKGLLSADYKISCGGVTESQIVRKLLSFDLLQSNSTGWTNETMAAVLATADWQTALWTAIFMIVAVIISVYVVNTIESEDITSWIIVDLQEKSI